MKTLIATIFLSSLPFTSIVAYQELRSMHNVAKIEAIRSLPVHVELPSESEIEVEFVPFYAENATVEVVTAEIEIEFIPAHRVR